MKKLLYLILFSVLTQSISSQIYSDNKLLLIRCDDIGMSHSVNLAAKELIDAGLKFSASVMVPCGWFDEAVSILKDADNVSIGIHLTLNSEWKNYRWGPVAGSSKVASLVDSLGYFFPSRVKFFANNPSLDEVEIELRAQIEKAFKSGLKISYLDYHMGTAVDKPEMRKIVEKLASEYKLAISRYFGEIDVNSMYSVPIDSKYKHLISVLDSISTDKINLLVCHIGKDTEEMSSLVDLNEFGLKDMSKHRNAELLALLKVVSTGEFEKREITLINYEDVINYYSLDKMKSPLESGY
ncbi:MAG: ChbG/HpnK family deacetylase [Ignavibacterium sp.]